MRSYSGPYEPVRARNRNRSNCQFPRMLDGLAPGGPGMGAMTSSSALSMGALSGAVNTVPGADLALAELLKTLMPQPDYLPCCLTPVPLETLDDYFGGQEGGLQ